jgi:hypothetical protein
VRPKDRRRKDEEEFRFNDETLRVKMHEGAGLVGAATDPYLARIASAPRMGRHHRKIAGAGLFRAAGAVKLFRDDWPALFTSCGP